MDSIILVYLLLGITCFWSWLYCFALGRDADIAFDITFEASANVTRNAQHCPFIDELVTYSRRESRRMRETNYSV